MFMEGERRHSGSISGPADELEGRGGRRERGRDIQEDPGDYVLSWKGVSGSERGKPELREEQILWSTIRGSALDTLDRNANCNPSN